MKLKIIAFLTLLMPYFIQAQNTLAYTSIDAHYNSGIELFEKKAYPAARKQFQTYIQKSENSLNPNEFNIANSRYYVALSALNSKAKDADIEVERFVTKYPNHPKAKLIFSDLGNSLFDKGDYGNAITYLLKSLENRQENLNTYEIRYKLGLSYYLTKDFKNALIQFDKVKNTAAPNAINAAYYAGVIHFQNQNYQEAYTDLKRVENVNPYKADVPNWIGQILYRQKKYTELIEYAEPIIANQNGRKVDDLALLTAEVYYFNDNFEKASVYYDKFKTLRKNATEQVNFRHGYSLYRVGNFEKAAQILRASANNNSGLGQESAYYLGISALKTGDLNSAMAAFETAKKLSFDKEIKEEAEYNFIKVLVEKNSNQQAVIALQQYLKTYPNGKYVDESNELLSSILSETNSYVSAINYIESLKRRTPKIDEAYQKLCYNQGVLEFNLEKFEEAVKYFNKAIAQSSSSDITQKSRYWKAESYAIANKPEAEWLYKDAMEKTEGDFKLKSQYGLAYLYFNAKEYGKAQASFSDFVDNAKGKASLLNNYEDANVRLGDCFLASKNYNEALKVYDKAYIENKTDKDYILYQKGLTLKYLDKDDEAKDVFDKFNKLYSNSRLIDDALFQNGIINMEKGNYQNSINIFSELLSKRPNSILVPQVLLKRAISYSNLQNHDKALVDFKQILNKYSTTKFAEEALLGVKESLNSLNRSEDFGAIADQYRKNNPSSNSAQDLQFDAARDLYYAEKYDKAITAFQQYNVAYPDNANVTEAKFLIAESFFALGKKDDALTYYEDLVENNQTAYISKSAMRAGDINFQKNKYEQAIKNYNAVLSASSGQREVVLAQEGIYKSQFLNGEYDKCIETCNKIIAEGGNTVIGAVNKAILWKGKALTKKKEYQAAKLEFQKVISMAKDINGAEAKYNIGEIHYTMKEYDTSIKVLQELSNDFSDFELWYEKAFLLISDNYVAKNDIFMAKATLSSIIENSSNKETVETAKSKLKTISK